MTTLETKMYNELETLLRGGLNLLQAQLQLTAKYRDAVEAATNQIKSDVQTGKLK